MQIYWKFNLTHLGEVLSSILVSPGTERMTYDWVKAVPRLSTWYYVAIQVLFDLGILVSLVLIPGSTVGEGPDEELYFLSIGKLLEIRFCGTIGSKFRNQKVN